MALLCMVNSKIHGVQDAERQLSCTTVSIFAASTFSIALHGVLIEQLWMGKHPGLNRSAGPLIQARGCFSKRHDPRIPRITKASLVI